jgi:ribosomal protein L24
LIKSLIETEVEIHAANLCLAEEEMHKEKKKAIESEKKKEEDAPAPEEQNKEEPKTEELIEEIKILKNILGSKEENGSPEANKQKEKSP